MNACERRESRSAALYIRSSSGIPGSSMGAQLKVLQHFAGRNGMLVAKAFFHVRNDLDTIELMMTEATGDDPPFRLILLTSHSESQELQQARQQWSERLEGAGVEIISVSDPLGALP